MVTNEPRLRLLLVDDDPGILEVLERYFELDARITTVATAQDAEEALEAMTRESPFDVVVCDQRLPDLGGVEVLTEVRRRYPNTIRILMTGYQDRDAAVQAINHAKIHRYVQKPVELSTLANTLWSLVEEREMRRVDTVDLLNARDMARAIQDQRKQRDQDPSV